MKVESPRSDPTLKRPGDLHALLAGQWRASVRALERLRLDYGRERNKAERARLLRAISRGEKSLMDGYRLLTNGNGNGDHGHTATASTSAMSLPSLSDADAERQELIRWYCSQTGEFNADLADPHTVLQLRRRWRRDPESEAKWCQQHRVACLGHRGSPERAAQPPRHEAE